MRWGIDQWLITDTFRREWRFWIVPIGERPRDTYVSRWDMVAEPLFHILPQAFSSLGAREDEVASDLLAIYDALTGSRFGDDFPRPTDDRRRRLRGFDRELSRVLYAALEAGVLKFERYEVPWPFPEKDEKDEERPPERPPGEGSDTVHLQLVSQDGLPIPEVEFIVHFADGSQRRGRLDRQGEAILQSTPKGAFEVEYLDPNQIRARALAARAHRAIAQGDTAAILGVAGQSSTLLKMINAAYTAYFGGGALADDVKAAVAGKEGEAVALHLLHVGKLTVDPNATVVAMTQPNPTDPTTEPPAYPIDPTGKAYA